MSFRQLIVSICGGVLTGWLYSGYRYYGTIKPSKQTYERLVEHAKNCYKN